MFKNRKKSILICGNTNIIDEELVKTVSEYYDMTLLGPSGIKKKMPGLDHYPAMGMTEASFVIRSGSFEHIWYFSGYLNDGDGLENETALIKTVLAGLEGSTARCIVVSPKCIKQTDGCMGLLNVRESEHIENLIVTSVDNAVVLQVPFLLSRTSGYIQDVFEKKEIILSDNEMEILSTRDLAELLLSVTEVQPENQIYAVKGFKHTCREFGSQLENCGISVTYARQMGMLKKHTEDTDIFRDYGFVAVDDIFKDIDKLYREYKYPQDILSRFKRLQQDPRKKILLSITELVVLFLIMQLLVGRTSDLVYFRYVDIRLFFVLLVGIVHGMRFGATAGILACFSIGYSYTKSGIPGTMVIYNTDYWLPFVIYMITGTITGYIVDKKDQENLFVEEERHNTEEKYKFLHDVHDRTVQNKDSYRKQILSYQDSYGKVLKAVEELNSSSPSEIFMNSISTLEQVLDNRQITIYLVDENKKFLRLAACSKGILNLEKSIAIDEIMDIFGVISKGETYKNIDLVQGYPMYACGISEDNDVRLMVAIMDVSPEQMELDYMNLFTVVCHLIQLSFIKAMEYQMAIEDKKYIDGTKVMKEEYFSKELETYRKMQKAGELEYVLLKLKGAGIEEVDKKYVKLFRHNDILGVLENGIYLLLPQVGKDSFGILKDRFAKNGIDYEVV